MGFLGGGEKLSFRFELQNLILNRASAVSTLKSLAFTKLKTDFRFHSQAREHSQSLHGKTRRALARLFDNLLRRYSFYLINNMNEWY